MLSEWLARSRAVAGPTQPIHPDFDSEAACARIRACVPVGAQIELAGELGVVPMRKKRIGVLMGGWSAEREVSLRTGDGVVAALEARGHDVVRLVWGPGSPEPYPLLRPCTVDVSFLALHGR